MYFYNPLKWCTLFATARSDQVDCPKSRIHRIISCYILTFSIVFDVNFLLDFFSGDSLLIPGLWGVACFKSDMFNCTAPSSPFSTLSVHNDNSDSCLVFETGSLLKYWDKNRIKQVEYFRNLPETTLNNSFKNNKSF